MLQEVCCVITECAEWQCNWAVLRTRLKELSTRAGHKHTQAQKAPINTALKGKKLCSQSLYHVFLFPSFTAQKISPLKQGLCSVIFVCVWLLWDLNSCLGHRSEQKLVLKQLYEMLRLLSACWVVQTSKGQNQHIFKTEK